MSRRIFKDRSYHSLIALGLYDSWAAGKISPEKDLAIING